MSLTAEQQVEVELAKGLASGKLSTADYTTALAAARGQTAPTSDAEGETAQSSPKRRAAVRVEPSDDPKFGDISIVKLLPNGDIKRRFNLFAEDALSVAEGIIDVHDQLS